MCLVVTCWERADLLALVCHFSIGILGQVWYLIVLIPDLCTLTYFVILMDLLCFFCLVFAMPLYASVYICLVVTCWERANLLALVCGVLQ